MIQSPSSIVELPHFIFDGLSSPPHLLHRKRAAVTAQVRRMLPLSKSEDRKVRAFQRLHSGAKSGGFGRVFRSPTLFEDMVKCILLCNCQFDMGRQVVMTVADAELGTEVGIMKFKCFPNRSIPSPTSASPLHQKGLFFKNLRQNEQRYEQEIRDIKWEIAAGNKTPDQSQIKFVDEALDEQKHSIRKE